MKNFLNYYKSPIGHLKIISNSESLISVEFVNNIKEEINSNKIIEDCITQLDEYFNGKRKIFNLNLSLAGTDFQKKVWGELLKIPFGEVKTYKEIANAVDCPNGSRAVGNANNKNRIAIIIPCHRVIGSNNSLTGYAAGIDIKKWLLEHEERYK